MNKNIRIFAATLLVFTLFINYPDRIFSQSWDTYDISFSGCSASFPYEPEWDLSYSDDSSLVWLGEVLDSDMFFGLICIEFNEPFSADYTKDDLILVAENYLDYLQSEFNIVAHTGYSSGYTVSHNEDACWVTDEWEDAEGDPWLVKVYADPFNMAVMYIYSSLEYTMEDYRESYFNSFRFPE